MLIILNVCTWIRWIIINLIIFWFMLRTNILSQLSYFISIFILINIFIQLIRQFPVHCTFVWTLGLIKWSSFVISAHIFNLVALLFIIILFIFIIFFILSECISLLYFKFGLVIQLFQRVWTIKTHSFVNNIYIRLNVSHTIKFFFNFLYYVFNWIVIRLFI